MAEYNLRSGARAYSWLALLSAAALLLAGRASAQSPDNTPGTAAPPASPAPTVLPSAAAPGEAPEATETVDPSAVAPETSAPPEGGEISPQEPESESAPGAADGAAREPTAVEKEVECDPKAPRTSGTVERGGRPRDFLLDEQTPQERQKCLEQADARPSQLNADEYPLTPPPPASQDRRNDAPTAIRWSSVGAFVGVVHRPSGSSSIRYNAGIAYGGYFRPELFSWLGVRLFYRKEFLPVAVSPGAFAQGDTPDLAFQQSKLNVTSLGLRIEPAWVIHPRFRVLGVLGWSWLRFVAELPSAPTFQMRADRAAVEMNWQLGAGVNVDLIKNWLELSVAGTYNFAASQGGSAYRPIQALYEGRKFHIGPLPRLKNATDVLIQLGLIL